MLHPFIEY